MNGKPAFAREFLKRFADLPLIGGQSQLPAMDGDIAELEHLTERIDQVAADVIDELQTWFWSHELNAAGARLSALFAFTETPFVMDELPHWETFQEFWEQA